MAKVDSHVLEAEAVSMLEESVRTAPVIWKGEYPYFIHPLTDGVLELQVIFLLRQRSIAS